MRDYISSRPRRYYSPRMLIMAWFSTWNSARRSRTRSLNTVIVISFSGSLSMT